MINPFKMNFFGSITKFLVFFTISLCIAEPQLELLNVIFRHGDRTPSLNAMFPKDPYYNSSFYPYGLGALTSSGKFRSYRLGEFLRSRYKNFLGDVYLPELLSARSTGYDRTIMSLQLVLAALFPPKSSQKWHDSLNWQPIPFTYAPKYDDELLGTVFHSRYAKERKRVVETGEVRKRLESFHDFMVELTDLTGMNISTSLDMKKIYDTLTSEKFMNLTLPEWADNIFPDGKLLDGILLDYDSNVIDDTIISSLSGKLMKKITSDMLKATNKTAKREDEPKLYLYSCHDINVAAVLGSLRVFESHVPEYASAVIIELLKDDNEYFVKVLYYSGVSLMLREYQLPGCDVLCPIKEYLSVVQNVMDLA